MIGTFEGTFDQIMDSVELLRPDTSGIHRVILWASPPQPWWKRLWNSLTGLHTQEVVYDGRATIAELAHGRYEVTLLDSPTPIPYI